MARATEAVGEFGSVLAGWPAAVWGTVALAALGVGISKGGFGGVGMVSILLMAEALPARESTGALLVLLIMGDVMAVRLFHRHAEWKALWPLFAPTLVGIGLGWWAMGWIEDAMFRRVIGGTVLGMTALAGARWAGWISFDHVARSVGFAVLMGILGGATTMMANAAGPVMALFFLAFGLPKYAFVGTSAWFFLIVNLVKVPFSVQLGLIHADDVMRLALLFPCVVAGVAVAREGLKHVSQRVFEGLILAFTAAAALRLVW